MFLHHDFRAVLPDIQDAGMGQEYDSDEPPDQVLLRFFTERWYLTKAQRMIVNVCLYVALIGPQIEFFACLYGDSLIHVRG